MPVIFRKYLLTKTDSSDKLSVSVSSQQKFTEEMFSYLLSRLDGSHEDEEVINTKPSRKYILGTLASRKDSTEDSMEQDEGRASVRARRLKVSFLVKRSSIGDNSNISIKLTGFIYYPIEITEQEDSESQDLDDDQEELESTKRKRPSIAWKRLNLESQFDFIGSEIDSEAKSVDFTDVIDLANNDKKSYTNIDNLDWNAEVSVGRESFGNQADTDIVTIYLTNNAVDPTATSSRKERMIERTLFDCRLNVTLDNIDVQEFEDEYDYEGFGQRYFYDFRPVNCQAYWQSPGKNFVTRHYGKYKQDSIVPRHSLPGLDTAFSKMSSKVTLLETLDRFLTTLNSFHKKYEHNFEQAKKSEKFQPRYENRQYLWNERRELIDQFHNMITRIEEGIEEIKTDPKIMNAFMKMNESFNLYYSNRGIPDGRWRLFQIAFVLATLTSITKMKYLDVVDILHVNTGGGKSEAYFALVVFASFYDRACKKSDGVTAIVKFPLRMLSIQQLERISSIIIYAEKVRKSNEADFPGTRFSLGYFVGDSPDFPQYYKSIKVKLYEGNELKNPTPPSLIISNCPLCENGNRGVVRLLDDELQRRIVHKCDKCGNEYLIVSTAREIYRIRPTVIVSTVDKWASLSDQRRVRNLLGGKGSQCPKGHGFVPSGDECEDKRDEAFQCKEIGQSVYDSKGPILSIQDEMHLLSEGFGTISGHFDGLLESFVEHSSGRKLKHITMSATLNGASHQAMQLYNKRSFVIPGRCPEEPGGETDFFFERKSIPKRLIFGMKPNLRDNHYAALRSVLHSLEFVLNSQLDLIKNPEEFCTRYNVDREGANELIKQFIIPLTYHIKKQDAYDMDKFEREVITPELSRIKDIKNARCDGNVITGDNSLEELKIRINSIKQFVADYQPNMLSEQNTLEPLYATSVVSHGVDLDELNLMIFQGLPYSTSEYIQALSRVGRKHLGIILLWFYPNRVRDDSFYRNFVRYHETLDHQVKPIPIKRLSRLGLHQTINSIFCGTIINYLSDVKGFPNFHKEDVEKITFPETQDIVRFIRKCYTGKFDGGALNVDLEREVEERINHIKLSREREKTFFPEVLANSGYYFYRNQSGMRGIQRQLVLDLDLEDQTKLRNKR